MKSVGFGVWLAGAMCAQGVEGAASLEALIRGEGGVEGGADLAALVKGMLGEDNADRLFYFPTKDIPTSPEKWGFEYEEVMFKSSDGTNLSGWFMPGRTNQIKGTIVFSHGNAGSMGHHLGFVMWLVEAGYNVFMYDYRGFGQSAGSVDRQGMIADVSAAFDYVITRDDVDPALLISFGHSLGGAKSITAFAQRAIPGLRAIIVDGAFSSYRQMAGLVGGELAESLITDDFSPQDYVEKIMGVPLLVVHGENDEVVPLSQGEALFQRANQPKTMFKVKGGTHGDALSRDNGEYRAKVLGWLGEVLSKS